MMAIGVNAADRSAIARRNQKELNRSGWIETVVTESLRGRRDSGGRDT